MAGSVVDSLIVPLFLLFKRWFDFEYRICICEGTVHKLNNLYRKKGGFSFYFMFVTASVDIVVDSLFNSW
jgi:hypothetical protein